MDALKAKKLTILYVLEILKEYSDAEHPLTQGEIVEILSKKYGIEVERKAVGRNVLMLKDGGYDIVSLRKGCYLESRPFETSELRLLIDSVLSSRHINALHSRDLINKLASQGGKYFRDYTKHLYNVNEWQKSKNTDFFLNIEVLNEAIEKGTKVEFFYTKYNLRKAEEKTSQKKHLVSPYQMLLHNQHYFLVGKFDKYDDLTFFRLDKITDIELTEDKITPITDVKGYSEGINLAELSTTLPYMFFDKPVEVEIRCPNWMINDVIDWFGTKIPIFPKGSDFFTTRLKVSPRAMIYWVMQYNENVEVLSPKSLRDEVVQKLKKMTEMYGINPR